MYILDYYSIYCIKDPPDFFSFINEYSLINKFMCFFDVYSLFTCILFLKNINICCYLLYCSLEVSPWCNDYSTGLWNRSSNSGCAIIFIFRPIPLGKASY